jgi:xanthine dehydrogenase large subunit
MADRSLTSRSAITSAFRRGAVGAPVAHDSAHLHVSGEAPYTDDIPEPRDLLHVAVGMSDHAHAKIVDIDTATLLAASGVVAVMTAADIPGDNNCGPVVADDPLFADGVVEYAGQSVFAVAATTLAAARRAARLPVVTYEDLEPVLDIRQAVRDKSFVLPSESIRRGNPDEAIDKAAQRLSGSLTLGGQDQFYLEGQISMAVPAEDGDIHVHSSTQHPDEVQSMVAHATGRAAKDVVVICRRMGGAFGGKESQAALIACIAALMTARTGRSCKLRLDRDDDMIMTGKRHDFVIDYDVGFNDDGLIEGIDFMMASRCGVSADLSGPVNDRAMFSCDNTYFLENIHITSHRCKTNTVSNTAFRGFGGPQGMFAIEYVIEDIARSLGKDPLDIRRLNFYGVDERNVTQYGQVVEDNIIHDIVDKLEKDSDYRARREAVSEFNRESAVLKKGLSLTPVKFGISFTNTLLNQAGALVHVYKDGTVHLNHGGRHE